MDIPFLGHRMCTCYLFRYVLPLRIKMQQCQRTTVGSITSVSVDSSTHHFQKPPTPENVAWNVSAQASDQECTKSWLNYASRQGVYGEMLLSLGRTRPRTGPLGYSPASGIKTAEAVAVYATLESFGPNSTYTACDGIPRLKFLASPNITVARRVDMTTTDIWSIVGYMGTMTVIDAMPMSTSPYLTTSMDLANGTLPEEPIEPQCKMEESRCQEAFAYLWGQYAATPDPIVQSFSKSFSANRNGLQTFNCKRMRYCELVMGEEVVLFYWPPKVTSRDICAANGYGSAQTIEQPSDDEVVITTHAITFKGQDLYPVFPWTAWDHCQPGEPQRVCVPTEYFTGSNFTSWINQASIGPSVLYGTWTFTSPSVYLAHHPITMRTTWKVSGSVMLEPSNATLIRQAGVIALNSDDVFSLIPITSVNSFTGTDFAKRLAEGNLNITKIMDLARPLSRTVQFDFWHLDNPVPASIYFNARMEDCLGRQKHCGTITDDSYRPIISINHDIWKTLLPSSLFPCRLPMLVDPPIALTRLDPVSAQLVPPTVLPAGPSPVPIPVKNDGYEGFRQRNSPIIQARPGSRMLSPFATATKTPAKPARLFGPEHPATPENGRVGPPNGAEEKGGQYKSGDEYSGGVVFTGNSPGTLLQQRSWGTSILLLFVFLV
jgi:hypothetical protein